jgi:hypothetical protein
MKHLSPINEKARRLVRSLAEHATPQTPPAAADVVALAQLPQQPPGAHIPLGCSTIFAPGWEVDRAGGTAGLCQPVERDLFDCHLGCFWPAQVPDQLNHAPDWTKKCAAAQKDWRKIDLIFP